MGSKKNTNREHRRQVQVEKHKIRRSTRESSGVHGRLNKAAMAHNHWLKVKRLPPSQVGQKFRLGSPSARLLMLDAEPFPKPSAPLTAVHAMPYTKSLQLEAGWIAALCVEHPAEVSAFVAARTDFLRKALSGDYRAATEALNSLEAAVGRSSFSIASRALIAEYESGLAASRSLFAELRSQNHDANFVLLAWLQSKRVERNITVGIYSSDLDDLCARWSPEAQDEASYHRFGSHLETASIDELPYALFRHAAHPIVDRYVALTKSLSIWLATRKTTADIADIIQHLAQNLRDPLLNNMAAICGLFNVVTISNESIDTLHAADSYTMGEYETTVDLTKTLLLERPECFELYELYSRASMLVGHFSNPFTPETRAHSILQNIHDITTRTDDLPAAIVRLRKLGLELELFPFGLSLLAFLFKQFGHSGHLWGVKETRLKVNPEIFAAANSSIVTARTSNGALSPSIRRELLHVLRSAAPNSLSVQLFLFKDAAPTNSPEAAWLARIPQVRKLKYFAHASARADDAPAAIQALESALLTESPVVATTRELIQDLFRLYMEQNDVRKCARLIVTWSLRRQFLLLGLPLVEFAARYRLAAEADISLKADICWPLMVSMMDSQRADTAQSRALYEAYDDYLTANGATKPSELQAFGRHDGLAPSQELIYFLGRICVLDVMDCSAEFSSLSELELERITICQWLLTADPINADIYSSEIARLTQARTVRSAVRHIEESKVYIDTEGIVASLEPAFQDRFNRYIAFSSVSLLSEPLRKVLEAEFTLPKSTVIVSETTFTLFVELFADIRSRFISSSDHGLDSYLSVRVRHGTLAGQLRSQFEKRSLVTLRGATGDYTLNEWARNALTGHSATTVSHTQRILAAFSRKVDETINVVKQRWIQIKSSQNPEGLFDFEYTQDELRRVYRQNLLIDNFDAFVDGLFVELWSRTEICLAQVQHKLRTQLMDDLIGALNSLERELSALDENVLHPHLATAIAMCRTGVQDDVETIAAWFKLSQQKRMPDFKLSVACMTALEITKNISPTRKVEISISDAAPVLFSGWTFSFLVDIFFILLENAVRHGDSPEVSGQVALHSEGRRLLIEVSNKVRSESNHDKCVQQAAILSALKDSASHLVKVEGGSGHHKLHKILRYDLNRQNRYDTNVQFVPTLDFQVTISIDLDGLEAAGATP